MNPEKLARKANQITLFFTSQPNTDPVEATAQHLKKFWSPAMRADLDALVAAGGTGLSPIALGAARLLQA